MIQEWVENLDDPDDIDLLSDPPDSIELDVSLAADLDALSKAGDPPATELRFIFPDQCASAPKRGYIIKGLIAPRDVAAIVGAPGCGKSTLAPLLGYMVAQGREAFGKRTKQGGVFYVAAEDETGLQMRVAALREDQGEAPDFAVVAGVSNLLIKDSPDFKALRDAVKEQRPSLVFIDTLAMAFPGLEENDAAAMGRVVAVARALTKWGAAVVLIHHDTKSGDGLPRGHSVLNGALDVAIALQRDGNTVTGKLSKNRNGPCDQQLQFQIEGAYLGEDEDGDDITAALCRPVMDDFAESEIRNPKERAFMLTLYSILEREGGESVCEKALRVELDQSKALSRTPTEAAQKRDFERTRKSLLRQLFLSRNDNERTLNPLYPLDMCFPELSRDNSDNTATSGNVTTERSSDDSDTPL
ncbi:AAA family ATPase [Marivita sp. S2033]|uniref:AAA family ATPase n=1 Tax=Marivita sp. S2033 TaxID=3373187 RepID=UPI00398257AC